MNDIRIILYKTKFPENIGMVARACANFACENLYLVQPGNLNFLNAYPLATGQGRSVLENMHIVSNLSDAINDCHVLFGATARTGGWRRNFLSPEEAAQKITATGPAKIGLLFGPEDRGLENSELQDCDYLIKIPTSSGATSLNLAQSVLIILYEVYKHKNLSLKSSASQTIGKLNAQITIKDKKILFENLKEILLEIDYLHGNNPDYFFQQWRHLISRFGLKRHEFNALLGLCRQLKNFIKINSS